MFYVYAISSVIRNYIYVGLTNNVERRFAQHSRGENRSTKAYKPFILILKEEYQTRIEARRREKYLKSGVGKEYIKSLLK
jgi:putative endonuclease